MSAGSLVHSAHVTLTRQAQAYCQTVCCCAVRTERVVLPMPTACGGAWLSAQAGGTVFRHGAAWSDWCWQAAGCVVLAGACWLARPSGASVKKLHIASIVGNTLASKQASPPDLSDSGVLATRLAAHFQRAGLGAWSRRRVACKLSCRTLVERSVLTELTSVVIPRCSLRSEAARRIVSRAPRGLLACGFGGCLAS